MTIKARARAKINLTLDVLGLRPDGFHQVETVMQSIALHDTLEFTPARGDLELKAPGGEVSEGMDNLVYRAAELMRGQYGVRRGARIALTKRIPIEAGLGGGSADAAATLTALNDLWELGLSLEELINLGQRLGSDVPFCLMGGTVLASGRGELLKPLPPCPPLGVVLIKPPWNASTAAVYRTFDAVTPGAKPDASGMIEALKKRDSAEIAGKLVNVLEAAVMAMHPAMDGIKNRLLLAGAQGALMSGSGSAVFGITGQIAEAYRIADHFHLLGERILITETWNPNP